MKPFIYGLILYVFLALPPVINVAESIMSIHMHIQMPLLALVGMLMTPLLKERFPRFFATWNEDGTPGILLSLIVLSYWLIPRAMDDALMLPLVEVFKFISLPFLIGVPFMDSWRKLSKRWKHFTYTYIIIAYFGVGALYIFAPDQLCNNYLIMEQRILGWIFFIMGLSMFVYFIYILLEDMSASEEDV